MTDVHDTPATPQDETFRGEAVTLNVHAASWWGAVGVDGGVGYQYNVHRWQALVGPAVRWRPAPFVLGASLRAGWASLGGKNWTHGGEGRAMVSPGASAELELGPRWYLGLRCGLDLPLGTHRAVTQRFLATQGFRF